MSRPKAQFRSQKTGVFKDFRRHGTLGRFDVHGHRRGGRLSASSALDGEPTHRPPRAVETIQAQVLSPRPRARAELINVLWDSLSSPEVKSREAAWAEIISAVERLKGEGWGEFYGRHGDRGRDGALWLGRRAGRLWLAELGWLAGGTGYAAVAQALARVGRPMERTAALRQQVGAIEEQMRRSRCDYSDSARGPGARAF